jgi:uncharacterized SAM-binding protein YcdF (DUF218 family)
VFFFWSKVLDLVVDPIAWALALALVALVRRRRAAGLAAVVVAWTFSTPAVSDALGRLAERDARDTTRPGAVYDAVVVLGGYGDVLGEGAAARLELNPAADRLVRAFEVLESGRARAAVLSAGEARPRPGTMGEAEASARLLAGWGIDRSRLVVEERSLNTRQNALEVARIVRERGWRRLVLLTSAAHMPRALGCFRAVGLEPDALPVDFRAERPRGGALERILPRARALGRSAEFLRELAGRAAYRAAGYVR